MPEKPYGQKYSSGYLSRPKINFRWTWGWYRAGASCLQPPLHGRAKFLVRFFSGFIKLDMRIAYFSECLTPGQDGVSRVLQQLAAHQRAQGNALCWVTAIADPNLPEPQLLTASLPLPGYAPYRISLGGARRLLAQLREFRPDVLHVHAPFWLGWAATRLARRLGIPCVATYHTDFIGYVNYHRGNWLAPLLRAHNRAVYNACALTLAPSRAVQADLTRQGIARTRVLPHGVDTVAFNPRFRSAAWRDALGACDCILLYVGRLVWEKNLALLAQVLPDLLARRPDVAFVFVGEGPARAELERQLPQAHLLGYQSGEALSTAYASSDALVFPSATETFGNVTLEAMASGLACLVADAGGSAELVEHRVTGLKFDPASAISLAENLRELVGNAPQRHRLAQQGHAFAQTQGWDDILDQQQGIYEELVTKHQRVGAAKKAAPKRPSARKLTRDLAGWSPPAGSLTPARWQPSQP